jgi:hypothetical protein
LADEAESVLIIHTDKVDPSSLKFLNPELEQSKQAAQLDGHANTA